MSNQQQDASPAKVNVVMLDTERYDELLKNEAFLKELIDGGYADLNWYWADKENDECI